MKVRETMIMGILSDRNFWLAIPEDDIKKVCKYILDITGDSRLMESDDIFEEFFRINHPGKSTKEHFELRGFVYDESIDAKRTKTNFYKSDEWRSLRYRVLKCHHGCCDLCGRSRAKHGVILHVDHIKPRSLFPELELEITNMQVLCEECNLGKSNKDETDWR